jgi:hypothetical protein
MNVACCRRKITFEQAIVLHKRGDKNATINLFYEWEPVINKYSFIGYIHGINENLKSIQTITFIEALNKFDFNRLSNRL